MFYTHQFISSLTRVDCWSIFLIIFHTHQFICSSTRVDRRGILSSRSKTYPYGWLYRLPIILVVPTAPCLSFVCLSASCLPCPFDVTRYAFKNNIGKMLHNITRAEQALTADWDKAIGGCAITKKGWQKPICRPLLGFLPLGKCVRFISPLPWQPYCLR